MLDRRTLAQPWHLTHAVRSVAFSPDGENLAVSGPSDRGFHQRVTIWEARTRRTRAILDDAVLPEFTPDGNILVTRTDDGCAGGPARLWDTGTWQPRFSLQPGRYAVSFGGELLAKIGTRVV